MTSGTARRKQVALTPDSIDEQEQIEIAQQPVAVEAPIQVADGLTIKAAMIEVSLTYSDKTDYTPKHVDLQLSPLQAETMKAFTRALHDSHAKLLPTAAHPSGKHVDTTSDALRYLVEQIAGAV